MLRLLEFAIMATNGDKEPVLDWASLGLRLGVSSAVITNWKARGVSEAGAIQAERMLGCSAVWVLFGEGLPQLTFSKDALKRAEQWANLGPVGRKVFDGAMTLAQQAQEEPAKYSNRERSFAFIEREPSTVPGDLPDTSVVLNHQQRKQEKTSQPKKGRRRS